MKPCAVCAHPERAAIDEALRDGAAYKTLTGRFGVPIGALKRHRRAHMAESRSESSAPAHGEISEQPVYLRFGRLPSDGVSRRFDDGTSEGGLSVFAGRRTAEGAYELDVPLRDDVRERARTGLAGRKPYAGDLVESMVLFAAHGRALFVVRGTLLERRGMNGEPLLANASAEAISPFVRVDLPVWLGEPGRKFAQAWNRWRRELGSGALRSTQARSNVITKPPARVADLAADVVHEGWEATAQLNPELGPGVATEREEVVREVLKG